MHYWRANWRVASIVVILAAVFIGLDQMMVSSWDPQGDSGAVAVSSAMHLNWALAPFAATAVFSVSAGILNARSILSAWSLVLLSSVFILALSVALAVFVVVSWGYQSLSLVAFRFVCRLTGLFVVMFCVLILPFTRLWLNYARSK